MKAAVVVLAVLIALMLASESHAATSARCTVPRSATAAVTDSVRVYFKGDETFACYLPTGRTRRLGDLQWVGELAASGRYVAWDMSSCDSHDICVSRGVRVVDMKTRVLRREALPRNDGSYATRIVLTTAGSAAWIRARDFDNAWWEVRKLEGRRQTVLDAGAAIEPWSLASAGYPHVGWRIYWTNAGAARTARLR